MYIVFKIEKKIQYFKKLYKSIVPSVVFEDNKYFKNNPFTHVRHHIIETITKDVYKVHFCVFSVTSDNQENIKKIVSNLEKFYLGKRVYKLDKKTGEKEYFLSESDLTLLNINIAVEK